ncbi:acetyltransferase, GNAT family [Paenibacillus sp. oral taxon 786 str. D14]|uniref:GNAT family N-acetyltransferase n=1 Tax=unclassified Paenibacillus TaxID=185978 RepID=UPI0001AFCDA4|nr:MULTISPECIES: GNAT family N-acetyltransferase [unclassified Paenibacillus]EES73362.1 acetyltransferase, GNAT family [Paenibacillus sp. oral taxon 786 str. D14]MCT2197594.1 GNAT family N-acetyltransferase [Paenibacillus sp. p3-SID1389]
MINLKDYNDRKEIINLLAECMFSEEERVVQEYEQYKNDQSRILLGRIENQKLVGLLGIVFQSDNEVELKHIAIKSSNRRQGLGTKLIMEFLKENHIRRIEAETDKDAVDFYRKIGFYITTLGEKYPGVERYKCILINSKFIQEVRNFT